MKDAEEEGGKGDESEDEERLEARSVKVRRGDETETYGGLEESD